MKEKILSFLKTKLSGVPETFLLGVADHYAKTITEETQIATTLTDGVVDLLKLNANILQVEGDKRATEAAKTALKNYQEKHGLDENGKPITKDPPKKKDIAPPDPDEPAWFKAYREQKDAEYGELKTKLEKQEKEKTQSALIEKFKAHEKIKGIPSSFLKGRNLIIESEDQIDQLAGTVETDFNTFKQEMAEQGVTIIAPPKSDGGLQEGEAMGKNIAAKRNANTSEGVEGKKV